jgi:molybdenum cofactor cytidylyltransferase
LIGGVVLAAGSSSRLGRPKQLLDLDGKPVLQHVVDACAASRLDEIVIVIGHEGNAVQASLRLPENARVKLNPDYSEGQSTSLAMGLTSLSPTVSVAVVVLGDQPGIRSEMIETVIEASATSPIVRATYGGVPGHPVSFARSEWGEVCGEPSDAGARHYLDANPHKVFEVDLGDEPPADIDTEADYASLRSSWPPKEPTRDPPLG